MDGRELIDLGEGEWSGVTDYSSSPSPRVVVPHLHYNDDTRIRKVFKGRKENQS